MFEKEKLTTGQLVETYKEDVQLLAKFLPYLAQKSGETAMSVYTPDQAIETTMRIPTYDTGLLSFIRQAERTQFINKNYDYVYRRYSIRSDKDEMRMIDRARIQDMEILGAILSRYVIRGRVKGAVWNEGVKNGVYYCLVSKMQELIAFWDV